MNRTVLFVGFFIAAAVIGVLFVGLGKDPQVIDSPLIGHSAPPFALKAVGSGETINLAQFRGRPVVLNFWATWCGPCYEEHPTLVANARQLQPSVQFLGVVFQDTEDKIQKFLNERGRAIRPSSTTRARPRSRMASAACRRRSFSTRMERSSPSSQVR